MIEEKLISDLKKALAKAGRRQFSSIPDAEKKELSELSEKVPRDLEIMKNGSRSQVGGYQLANGREVVLKYYIPKNIVKRIRNRFIATRCKQSWLAAHGLSHLGIPTPAPLAISEHFQLGLIHSLSFLATDRAHGTPLRFLESDRYEAVAPALKEAFQIMANFHVAHGDLKASNIIVDDQNKITFIDLDATQFNLRGKSWDTARKRDLKRFRKNWNDNPGASSILNPCID